MYSSDDIGDWGPIWLATKPNMFEWGTAEEGERRVAWGEMRLAKLAPRDDAVFRDKTTVRSVLRVNF